MCWEIPAANGLCGCIDVVEGGRMFVLPDRVDRTGPTVFRLPGGDLKPKPEPLPTPKGRRGANLADLQAAYQADPVLAQQIAGALQGKPADRVPMPDRIKKGERGKRPKGPTASSAYSRPADNHLRTTFADLQHEAREMVVEALPSDWPVWRYLAADESYRAEMELTPWMRQEIDEAYAAALKVLRETMPADRPRKHKHKMPSSSRSWGESSPVVVRKADGSMSWQGIPIDAVEASELLEDFDPYDPRLSAPVKG